MHKPKYWAAAMLLAVCSLTGCESGTVEKEATEASVIETTAEAAADAETTATETTQESTTSFSDYTAFTAAMAEQHPEATLYTPPESWTADWELQDIQLSNACYEYHYVNTADAEDVQHIYITIAYPNFNYNGIEEAVADLSIAEAGYEVVSTPDQSCCIAYRGEQEQTSVADSVYDTYELLGITGDFNTFYIVRAVRGDSGSNLTSYTQDELLTLRQELRL